MKNVEYYQSVGNVASEEVRVLSRRIATVSWLRFGVIVACGLCVWCAWGNVGVVIGAIVVAIIGFLALVKFHEKLFVRRTIAESRKDVADDNLRRINLDLGGCDGGEKYADTRHQYTHDLDIFGKSSLFSLLDTTAMPGGADILADWLARPENIRCSIEERQNAVKELSNYDDLRTEFRAYGMSVKNEIKNSSAEVLMNIPDFNPPRWKRYISMVFPYIMGVTIICAVLGLISALWIGYLFTIGLLISLSGSKRTGILHQRLASVVGTLSVYHWLIAMIEQKKYESPYLCELQDKLSRSDIKASIAASRLSTILQNMDQRYNAIGMVILDGFMMWDIRQLSNAQKWMEHYAEEMPLWYDALVEFDALCALATFAFNNENYIFPILDNDRKVVISGDGFGHPLIPVSRCVTNMIAPMRESTFFVVTGANMAGKSTYLRTVGVNYILALIGAPVFASKMIFTPVSLYTGLRTTDSLHDNESYFFAELSRLKSIIERAKEGERMFVILDEILKGTNSVDKQKGSLALVRKLIAMQVTGIIATHDLMLGKLSDEFPENVSNYRFEADIVGDNLTFSYKINPGIAQNMNAYFLMKKMEIV